MNPDSPSKNCPACGTPLPAGVSEKRCPACLLRAGMEAEIMPSDASDATDSMFDPAATPAPRETPGTMIGRYKLLQEIGEGGFGIVYLAEQTEPVRRKVALKMLKLGMDTREIVTRFEAERQALAVMDHRNIAQVYDGGATESGRPYFVMELVKGKPLTRHCDDHQFTIRQRLELFGDVLSAVQHAHHKGMIHRDLKPSNILVTLHDGQPVIKVIDFGIAKALSADVKHHTLITGFGQMIGTPQYASPEQADTNTLDVDTRSDVYSLGVVLYELLTGRTPLDGKKLRSAGIVEMQRLIREQEPPKPSAVPALMSESEATLVARRRQTEPGRLAGLLRGDLDWVVMKTLDKDRARRYQTANGLALDIRRFLDFEPVSASPPSISYRFLKFAKRHRFAAAWTVAVSLVVLLAAIGMTILYFKAVAAGEDARRHTWDALNAQVAAILSGKQPGRRFEALAALEKAAAIPEGMAVPGNLAKLQNAAVACVAIVDTRPDAVWPGNSGRGKMVTASRALREYACTFPDGRIAIHSYPDRKLKVELPGEGRAVNWVLRFSPDGTRLAAACDDADAWQDEGNAGWALNLWNAAGGGAAVKAGTGVNKAFSFFPDGKACAVGRVGAGGAVLDVISSATGESVRRFPLPAPPHSISISEDGRLVAVSFRTAELVQVLDGDSGAVLAGLPVPAPNAVAWAPLENSLAVCSADFRVRVWHNAQWKVPAMELAGHAGTADAVVWSPDGRLLASCGWDNTVRLWDPFQGRLLSSRHGRASGLEFSADGTRLGFLREGETLTVLEVAPGNVCYRGQGHGGELHTFQGIWNAEGSLMASSGDDGVGLWNVKGQRLVFLPLRACRGLAFSQDSLYVASQSGIQRWPLTSGTDGAGMVVTLHKPEPVGTFRNCEQLVLSPDGSVLAVAGEHPGADGKSMWLVSLKNGQPPRRLESPAGVNFCAMSNDGRWLAAGTWQGSGVRIWSLPDAATPVDLPIHGSATVGFSPDNHWLVTGDTEAYRFWKIGSWELDKVVPSFMGEHFGRMAFSPRTTAVAIAVSRDELKVLQLQTLKELTAPDLDHEYPVCFDPTGMILVTSGQSGLFFWKLDAVRNGLRDLGLDWKELPPFPTVSSPVIGRVILPAMTTNADAVEAGR